MLNSALISHSAGPSFLVFFRYQERKKELAALNSQLQAGRAASAEKERISKGREAEIAGRLAIAQARLCKVGEEAARTKGEQLAAVLAESQVVSGLGDTRQWVFAFVRIRDHHIQIVWAGI